MIRETTIIKKQISNIPIHLMVCGNGLGKWGKEILHRDHSDKNVMAT